MRAGSRATIVGANGMTVWKLDNGRQIEKAHEGAGWSVTKWPGMPGAMVAVPASEGRGVRAPPH